MHHTLTIHAVWHPPRQASGADSCKKQEADALDGRDGQEVEGQFARPALGVLSFVASIVLLRLDSCC